MAHVKWNMGSAIAITNQETGETMFLPCEGIEVNEALYNKILTNPTSVTNIRVRFKWDENNQSVRAYLELALA